MFDKIKRPIQKPVFKYNDNFIKTVQKEREKINLTKKI